MKNCVHVHVHVYVHVHLLQYHSQFFLEWDVFHAKVVEKDKTPCFVTNQQKQTDKTCFILYYYSPSTCCILSCLVCVVSCVYCCSCLVCIVLSCLVCIVVSCLVCIVVSCVYCS